MERLILGNVSDFEDLVPKFIDLNGSRVFVYRYKGKFYCYVDVCPHQGGPACEGDTRGRVVGSIEENGLYVESISKSEYSIVCPWHGVEYDLENGECRTNRKMKLRRYQVVLDGDNVVLMP